MVKLKYVCRTVARGIEYYHIRLPGRPAIRLHAKPGSPEFVREYDEAMKAVRSGATPKAFERGTLGHLILEYQSSDRWSDLAPDTRTSYLRAIAVLDEFRAAPLTEFTRARILKMRDARFRPERGRWMANYAVTVLGILFAYALDTGIVSQNPLAERVRKIRPPRDAKVANRPWTPEERATVLSEAPPHIRLVVALVMTTGLRQRDYLTVTMSSVKNGEISVRTSKRRKFVQIPLHPLLIEAINARPASDALTIAVTMDGRPWTPDGWATVWQRFKTRLEKAGRVEPGLTMHGLRHTLGHMLHEAGASDRDIGDVLGNTIPGHYSRDAPMPEAAKERVRKLEIVRK
jgi:integrase